jgi:hypothetical protein
MYTTEQKNGVLTSFKNARGVIHFRKGIIRGYN